MGARNFDGKVVVITGAGGGLGRALCKRFGAGGARIAGLDYDQNSLDELKVELDAAGIDNRMISCDVTQETQCTEAINKVLSDFGKIDLLYNNAGISHRSAFAETDVSVIKRVMDINFFGSVYCTKAALDSIIKNKGMIIVMSSIAGFAPLIARTGYSASKHALHGFFESLRTELVELDVKVMIVCPSFVKTNIDKNALGGDGKLLNRTKKTAGNPSTPEAQAEIIFKAAMREKELLLPSPMSRLSYFTQKFIPKFYASSMIKTQKTEMG